MIVAASPLVPLPRRILPALLLAGLALVGILPAAEPPLPEGVATKIAAVLEAETDEARSERVEQLREAIEDLGRAELRTIGTDPTACFVALVPIVQTFPNDRSLRVIHRFSSRVQVPPTEIAGLLEHEDEWVRTAAIITFGYGGRRPDYSADSLTSLLPALENDDSTMVRHSGVYMLDKFDRGPQREPALTAAIAATRDEEAEIRGVAVWILGRINREWDEDWLADHDAAIAAAVEEVFDDEDPKVRRTAARVWPNLPLADLDEQRFRSYLALIEDDDPDVAAQALHGASLFFGPGESNDPWRDLARAGLTKGLEHEDPSVRAEAKEYLGE